MRWFIAGAAALVVLWAAYLASPFWAARDLAAALETGDLPRIEARVNFRALRLSVARQIASEALAQKAALGLVGGSEAQLATSALAVASEPMLGEIVTAQGLAVIVRTLRPAVEAAPGRPDLGFRGLGQIPAVLASSRWRGFRTVYITLPPRAPPDSQIRLQLRLSRLSWRLVALELTPAAKTRLLDELIRRRQPRTGEN